MFRTLVAILLVVALAAGAGYWYYHANGNQPPVFRTAPVERGYLRAAIGATGTVEPEEVIDVGAQVAGRIDHFGVDLRSRQVYDTMTVVAGYLHPGDPVALAMASVPRQFIDYTAPVEEGTILAQLDPRLYQARVDSAAADVQRARATLKQQEAVYFQTEREWNRVQTLGVRGSVAGTDYDMGRSNYETARANLGVGKASIALAQAALNEARTNLDYTTIRSPVKGVIIDRRVNIGQTVVAGLSAPSLFLIAKDLRRMQVWASVNEADIGQIQPGQKVYFTVDARPGETFEGTVAAGQPRLNASMTNNVVTYTVVVRTDNARGRLLPYLTANLQFMVGERQDVLQVPNSSLRFRPQPNHVVPEERAAFLKSLHEKRPQGSAPRSKAAVVGKEAPKARLGTVWVMAEGGLVRPVQVQLGLSDGTMTEVLHGELRDDMEVVIGEAARQESGAGGANPFTPSVFGGKKKE